MPTQEPVTKIDLRSVAGALHLAGTPMRRTAQAEEADDDEEEKGAAAPAFDAAGDEGGAPEFDSAGDAPGGELDDLGDADAPAEGEDLVNAKLEALSAKVNELTDEGVKGELLALIADLTNELYPAEGGSDIDEAGGEAGEGDGELGDLAQIDEAPDHAEPDGDEAPGFDPASLQFDSAGDPGDDRLSRC